MYRTEATEAHQNKRASRAHIAVVGLAAWYPCGNTLKDFWANVVARRRAFRLLPKQRLSQHYQHSDPHVPDKTYVKQAAVIDGFEFDWVKRRVPKQVYECADVVHWLALEMAIRAIEDAGYDTDTLPRERMGVVIGNTLTGETSRANGLRLRWPFIAHAFRQGASALGYSSVAIDELLTVTEDVFKSVFPDITEDTLPGVIPNTIAGRICNYFDLKGGGYAVDGACSSSLIALAHAADALVNCRLDAALAGGVDISIDPFELVGFAKMGALAREDMYVYEQRSQGFLPGEGCAWVLLKRLEDAERDGDYIYAILKGWGMSSDGRGGLTAPSIAGQALAIQRAYEHAGYGLADIDFVEGHGTGTPSGDFTELSALARALGEEHQHRPLGITSLKSIIGHCKAAAGIGSFIKAVLAVNQRVVPPLAGCEKPHDVFATTSLYPLVDGRVSAPSAIMRAGVSSFGFGGINVHVTVESAAPPHVQIKTDIDERALFVTAQDSEVFFFCAATTEALRRQIEPCVEIADQVSCAEMTDLAAHLAQTLGDGLLRAAVIASNPEELKGKLESLLYMLKAPPAYGEVQVDPAREVWLGNKDNGCRVGFVFPGQGSQQLNMAQSLVERFAWARALVAEADTWVGNIHGQTLSGAIYVPLHHVKGQQEIEAWKRHLTQTEVCQPAICMASVLYARRLQQLGIEPSAVGGHSLGELTAFWAAGALAEQQLLALAQLRGACMAAPQGATGAMASLRCSMQEAHALCQQVSGYVVIANINSDRQVVVAGDPTAIDALLDLAGRVSIPGQRLPVSNAFHSWYVAAGADRLAREIDLPEQVPLLTTQLFTGMDGREITAGDELRAHFPKQIVERVDFVSLGAALAKQVELLIEVGPGRVLTGLLADNASTSSIMCLPVEAHPGKYKQLNQVLAAFFAHGGTLNLDALFEQRLCFPFVSPKMRRFIENPCEQGLASPDIPECFDRSLKGTFESQLPERTGYDKAVLAAYLEKRGTFLSEIVRADIAATQLDAASAPDVVKADLQARRSPVHNNGTTQTSTVSKGNREESFPAEAGRSVEDVLLDLVVERTGFPRDSLRLEMTLLNDLNIESIAAGEIIAKASHFAGVGGRIDPSHLLQASLQEVVDAIRSASGNAAPAPPMTVNAQDQSGLLHILEQLTGKPTWVRMFDVRYTEEPLTPLEPQAYEHVLRGRAVVVVSDPEQAAYAEAITAAFAAQGATAETTSYAALGSRSAVTPDILVSLLPMHESTMGASGEGVRSCMERLHMSATHAGMLDATLMYVQFGGGYFGSRPDLARELPFSASAFAASVHHERSALRVRVVDVARETNPQLLAHRVVSESVSEATFVRAGYDAQGMRRIPRPFVLERCHGEARQLTWSKDDVVVVTGGAKGVSSEIAFAMAEKTGAKMILLGRSPAPDVSHASDDEIAMTLQRFHRGGLVCRYVSCDVTDAAKVSLTLAAVQEEFGPITGILHGAGINQPALVGTESMEDAYDTVAPKVVGLLNILSFFNDIPPKVIVGLSSIIGITGMPGNAWYGFANEALDRLLQRYHQEHPETVVLSLAYSLWESVGMSVKLAGVAEQIRRMGTSAIPVPEATQCFLDLLERDVGREHLVIAARLNGLDTWCPDQRSIPQTRFLEEIATMQPRVELVSKVHLSLEKDPYLLEHVYRGTYLFPMVFGLEAMAQAVAAVLGQSEFEHVRIEDIDLARPIVVDPQEGEDILIHLEVLEPESSGRERRVAVGIACHQTNFSVDHFSAMFIVPATDAAEQYHPINRPEVPLVIDPVLDLYGRFLFHGAMFQRLRNFYVLRSDYCLFESEQKSPEEHHLLLGDPFFRDSLLQAGQVVISQDRGLPRHIKRLEISPANRHSAGPLLVEGVLHERTDKFVDCTITVVDESHRVLQKLEHCRFSIIEHLSDEPTAEEIAAPDARDQRLLRERLQAAAAALKVIPPAIALSNLPGLQMLSLPERHAREQCVLEQAIHGWRQTKTAALTVEDNTYIGEGHV